MTDTHLRSRRAVALLAVFLIAGCAPPGSSVTATGPLTPPPSVAATPSLPPPTPQPTPVPTAPLDIDAIGARVQAAADTMVAIRTGISVFLRVGSHERTIVAGLASKSPDVPVAPDVRFQIASITKPMTATVVMSLVEAGTLSLDDPVETWLPGLLRDGKTITIAQLLSHQSGLFNFTQLDDWHWATQAYTAKQLVKLAEAHGRAFAPGARAEYSNTGYVVLGLIIRAATGGSLRDELQTVVFDPAGMASAGLGNAPIANFKQARGYADGLERTTVSLDGAAAAGGVVATAEDVGHFLDALFEGQLLDRDTVANMAAVHSLLNGDDSYGYGLDPFDFGCGPVIGHLGSLPGFSTSAVRRVDGSRTAVIFVNDEPAWAEVVPLLTAALCD